MLILTRKLGETIIIGDGIRVVILEVRGKQVRLGIEAPADMVVLREELLQRLAQENLKAAGFHFSDLQKVCRVVGWEMPECWGLKETTLGTAAITVETKNLGRVTVLQDQIITFPAGLPGLDKFKRGVLLEEPRTAPFGFLQCVDDPDLCFVVAEPVKLNPDFRLGPVTSALKELEAGSVQELKALVILTIPPGRPQEMTANLQCPLLINPSLRRGKQVIMETSHYSHKHQVFPSPDDH